MRILAAAAALLCLAAPASGRRLVIDEAERYRLASEALAETEAIRAEAAADREARYRASIEGRSAPRDDGGGRREGRDSLLEEGRDLMATEDHHSHRMHRPLACNEGVELAPLEECAPFSALLADYLESPDAATGGLPLVIQCGTCAAVDVTGGSLLILPHGLRVEGRLHFPPSASLTVRTTFVLVLGLLVVDVPLEGNAVKFSLYGEDEVYFHPHPENSMACDLTTGCNVGSKVIAVAGGRVDIRGMPEDCPAWENVLDVGRAESEMPSAVPTRYPSARPSEFPSGVPTMYPTLSPTTQSPTASVCLSIA